MTLHIGKSTTDVSVKKDTKVIVINGKLFCTTEEKYIHVSEKDAKKELSRIRHNENQRSKRPTRSYCCDHCGGYHLTSMDYDTYRAKQGADSDF